MPKGFYRTSEISLSNIADVTKLKSPKQIIKFPPIEQIAKGVFVLVNRCEMLELNIYMKG